MFFFFKQKTAYELRISDLSSDVCSSDLLSADLARRVMLTVPAERCALPMQLLPVLGESIGAFMRIDADLRLSVHRANRSLTIALRCRADKLRPALERRRKVGPRVRPDRIARGARLVQRRALLREPRELPLGHAVDVGPRARVAFDRALRVLRSRRFGHRDAVFLYGRLETREDTARLLGRIAHDLGDPLTQCDAPLPSKGARGVFAGEVARLLRSEERRVGKECVRPG